MMSNKQDNRNREEKPTNMSIETAKKNDNKYTHTILEGMDLGLYEKKSNSNGGQYDIGMLYSNDTEKAKTSIY